MQKSVDVTIIGGGVQGVGIAHAVQAAGFSTLLLEKNTFGSATSSKSSKLIHGGLRYLQTAQFSLVRECLAEREWMFKHLPELVKPNWFYVPLYKHSKFKPWQLAAGLSVYQLLGAFNEHSAFKKVPKKEWGRISGLNTKDLIAVYAYQDGQTDDKALTQHIAKMAQEKGAICLEGAQFIRAAKLEEGYHLTYTHNGKDNCVHTKLLINAAGPWANHVLASITPAVEPVEIDLVQGTHIVLDTYIADVCFYLESPDDKRVVFVMPWKGKTLVGTTETEFTGEPENTAPLPSEVDYLLRVVKTHFPDVEANVVEQFSGLRVLPKSDSKAFFRPRDVKIQQEDKLITVCGGKLTSWRATAETVKLAVENRLGQLHNN